MFKYTLILMGFQLWNLTGHLNLPQMLQKKMIINSPNSYFSKLLEICDLRFRAWLSEPGMTSLHLWLWVHVLTCGNVWGQSKQLRLSVTPEHSQSAVMMWPVVCTPGHLLMAQSMETCWYSCGFTFQGHSDAAGHFFPSLETSYLSHLPPSVWCYLFSSIAN